jgi:hypothetical protein
VWRVAGGGWRPALTLSQPLQLRCCWFQGMALICMAAPAAAAKPVCAPSYRPPSSACAGAGGSLGDLVRRQMVRPYKRLYR